MFAVGLALFLSALALSYNLGNPSPFLMNFWDRLANVMAWLGMVLMAISAVIFAWGLLP